MPDWEMVKKISMVYLLVALVYIIGYFIFAYFVSKNSDCDKP